MKKKITFYFLSICLGLYAQDNSGNGFTPRIEGTIRGKYEYFTELDQHRFQVRNARFSVRGNFNSISFYKAEIDLSDEGRTRMLDAFVQLIPQSNWSITIGQQKIPFSTENLRSPHQLYFANRSFMAKQLTNLRDVGVSFNYINDKIVPFDFTAGIYNGMGLYTQEKTFLPAEMSYAARLVLYHDNPIRPSFNFNTIMPGNVRMNYYNAGVEYNVNNLHFEAEYLLKTYVHQPKSAHNISSTMGYVLLGSYSIKTPKLKNIHQIMPVMRFDAMSKNLKYEIQNANSIVMRTDEARSRFSTGINISLADRPFRNDIRLNYELYFWENNLNTDTKFVIEYMIKF